MTMSRRLKRKIGIGFWLAILFGLAVMLVRAPNSTDHPANRSVVSYLLGPQESLSLTDQSGRLEANDPVFSKDDKGEWHQVGYISEAAGVDDSSPMVRIAWHSAEVDPNQCDFFFYRSTGSIEEVLAVMLPPEKQVQIQRRLAAVMSEHGDELSKSFVPLVQQSLKRSLPIIESEFRRVVEEHRPDIDRLAEKWKSEIVNERLLPLAKKEIVPIVKKHGQPTAEEIGREIWNRASLWRFGWRAVYDKTPLPERNLVQEEWKRFVQSEAVPVIDEHMDDIVTATQRILVDVAANERVRGEVASVANQLAHDPETQKLVRTILSETLINNQKLRDAWGEVWTSDEARQAIDLAGDRLEPVIRQIGDDLFGTKETGIDPNFARVLRSQILGKDRQWVVAYETGASASQAIQISKKRMPYPVIYIAKRDPIQDQNMESDLDGDLN